MERSDLLEQLASDIAFFSTSGNVDVDRMSDRTWLRMAVMKHFITHPSFRSIYIYRKAHYHLVNSNKARLRFWIVMGSILSRIEIYPSASIGPGLRIPHPQCIVVGEASIGSNCWIYQGVTIGTTMNKERDHCTYPRIGDNVQILAGAKVIGPVVIGDNVIIGSNAVVVKDVAPGAVVGGVPAVELRSTSAIALRDQPIAKTVQLAGSSSTRERT